MRRKGPVGDLKSETNGPHHTWTIVPFKTVDRKGKFWNLREGSV